MGLKNSGINVNACITRHIGTAYDKVAIVAENIELIKEVGNNIPNSLKYLGAAITPPDTRLDGSPVEDGDYYFNTANNALVYYDLGEDLWFEVDPAEILEARDITLAARDVVLDAKGEVLDAEAVVLAARDVTVAARDVAVSAKDEAVSSKDAAALSESNAAASESSAATSASTATTKAAEASLSASEALTSKNAAASSASTAVTSANTATTKANQASTSASNAATSESNALASKNAAKTSETNAANSASVASTSAGSASTSASTATTKANEASASASSASTSASTATTKANQAAASATSASNSASAALASETSASQSAIDAGASKVDAAASAASASASASTATTKASEASSSATAASNSAASASTSASTATTKASEASASASSASTSASTATTKASEASASATAAGTSETNAKSSETIAVTKASEASTSAANALVSEQNAAASASELEVIKAAMTQAEFEANRAIVNEEMAASGFVHFGKHVEEGIEIAVNQGLYINPLLVNSFRLGRPSIRSPRGVSKFDLPIINIAGITFYLDAKQDAYSGALIKFPQAPDGRTTYNKSTGVITNHATVTDAFNAQAADPANVEVVTDRVDMWGFEAFLEEVNTTNPYVYPNGLIQSQAATMDGIATSASARPVTYYAVFDGDTGSKGKGVNFFALADAQKKKVLGNHKNNLYYLDDGRLVQWRLRQRTIAGVGNGDWGQVDSTIKNVLRFDSNNLIKSQGTLNASLPANPSWDTNTLFGTGTADFGSSEAGVFASKYGDTSSSVSGECYFLVCGTVSRLNQGFYHPSLNANGSVADNTGKFWYNTSLSFTHQASCFDLGKISYD